MHRYNVTVIDEQGTHSHRLVTPGVAPGNAPTVVINVTMLEPYKFYRVFIQAVSIHGTSSARSSLPFLEDLPSNFRGILSSPVMTPDAIASFYGLPNTTERAAMNADSASQAVGEFGLGESLVPSDLTLYQQECVRGMAGLVAESSEKDKTSSHHDCAGSDSLFTPRRMSERTPTLLGLKVPWTLSCYRLLRHPLQRTSTM